ncbi:hypothetical protein BBJ28_00015248 [Nothophytophthora sp. Chile5]|nr:hypothetical protein BBJ28_00015248 [Nothophytophthora sp. Chile5]
MDSVSGDGSTMDVAGIRTVGPRESTSVLQKFLLVRELLPTEKLRRQGTKASKVSKPVKPANDLLWETYTKRRHGQRATAQRAALRRPDDIFKDSVDVYVPRKRPQKLLDMHGEEQEVNEAFHTATRALYYGREVLDRPVCDRDENRCMYEERLRRLEAQDSDDEATEEVIDHDSSGITSDPQQEEQKASVE